MTTFNKAKHYKALYKQDLELLVDELYRYENFASDIKWHTDKGEHRLTDFRISGKRYSVEKVNGEVFSVTLV